MSEEFKVRDGGELKGYVHMNPDDMKRLNLSTLSIITFEDAIGNVGAGQVRKDDGVNPGEILVDRYILQASHIKHGDSVVVSKYDKELKGMERVEFVLEPISRMEEDVRILAEENIDGLRKMLDNRIIFYDMQIKWDELNCIVHIIPVKPKLSSDELGLLSWEALEYSFSVKGIAEKFNAILLIDTSGSMKKKDLIVRNIAPVIETLKDYGRDKPDFQAFLNRFKEGENVSRIMGAVLAAQLYLHRKIERGFGEKVAIVSFAKDVKEMTFKSKDGILRSWVSCKGEDADIGIKIASQFILQRCQVASGLTNMGAALEKAAEISDLFPPEEDGRKLPTMILLLTDGMPTTGRNPIDVVKEKFLDRRDVVIYTLGIGDPDEIGEETLKEIASLV
ncbi:MAG: VWA domain-containing protein, partial [Candidatus Asgardarchaeia archaeon]